LLSGKRKIDESITDFAVKPLDSDAITAILNTAPQTFTEYIATLSAPQFDELQKYVLKQRNIERITDHIINNNTKLTNLKVFPCLNFVGYIPMLF
jgi:arsenate reductase-like glutaredoxin family protein